MRSLWKGFYINTNLYYNYFILKKINLKVENRSSNINFKFINSTFFIYNGIKLVELKIFNKLTGYKLGSFAFTKKIVKHEKKKKKK